MAHLVIRQADGDGVRFLLEKGRTLIGSGAFNDLTLPLPGLGPTHLEIACVCDGGRGRFEARPVAGRPVEEARELVDGDRRVVGDTATDGDNRFGTLATEPRLISRSLTRDGLPVASCVVQQAEGDAVSARFRRHIAIHIRAWAARQLE